MVKNAKTEGNRSFFDLVILNKDSAAPLGLPSAGGAQFLDCQRPVQGAEGRAEVEADFPPGGADAVAGSVKTVLPQHPERFKPWLMPPRGRFELAIEIFIVCPNQSFRGGLGSAKPNEPGECPRTF